MRQSTTRKLKSNPFHTYRDEKTGKWVVVPMATPSIDRLPNVAIAS